MYVEQPYYYYFVINFYLRMFIKNALFLLSLSLSCDDAGCNYSQLGLYSSLSLSLSLYNTLNFTYLMLVLSAEWIKHLFSFRLNCHSFGTEWWYKDHKNTEISPSPFDLHSQGCLVRYRPHPPTRLLNGVNKLVSTLLFKCILFPLSRLINPKHSVTLCVCRCMGRCLLQSPSHPQSPPPTISYQKERWRQRQCCA